MSILVDDSNKTACRAAEAGLQQKNCAALVRPAGTGKGCIVWELLDAHPEMRVLWVVSCAARLELRRAWQAAGPDAGRPGAADELRAAGRAECSGLGGAG